MTSRKRDYRHHPYPYSGIIVHAIESAPEKQLSLQQIRDFMSSKFPVHFPVSDYRWKNTLRSQLSIHKCFYKVAGKYPEGRHENRFYWRVNLSRVPKTAFLRHDYNMASTNYPVDLHEYLNVPKIQLPCSDTSVGCSDVPLFNAALRPYDATEPLPKRQRTELNFGIDTILSDAFGKRPESCLHSAQMSKMPHVPVLSTSLLSDLSMEKLRGDEHDCHIMNSTRIELDTSVESLPAPFSPIEPDLSDEDLVESSLYLLDYIHSVRACSGEMENVEDIEPTFRSLGTPEVNYLLEYISANDFQSCSFSGLCDEDLRICV